MSIQVIHEHKREYEGDDTNFYQMVGKMTA